MKKTSFIIFVIAIFFAMGNFASLFAQFENNKILIRIKPGTSELQVMKNKGVINAISEIIPSYRAYRYIGDELLYCNTHYKRNENNYDKMQYVSPALKDGVDSLFIQPTALAVGENTTLQFADSPIGKLSRTFVVEYQENLDPVVFSQKMMTLPFVELAEAVPLIYFTDTPNDSLFSKQYYLSIVKSVEAAALINSNETIVLGVVDTGIDYLHEDIKENIYYNRGEMGKDSEGRDKSTNGIDDDGNGFVDDFRGWDFKSYSDTSKGDNDPMPGNAHGTHVGGTIGAVSNNKIGIAGVAKNVKLLNVKVGPDESYARNTLNPFHGLLYAAKMGAKIINCSWGSTSISDADKQILNLATAENCLIVAAAGNDGENIIYYPAAHKACLAVAALRTSNKPASFTNYEERVGICAPGAGIMATLPDDEYGEMSGTSMASPIVAGCAALLALQHPSYQPYQLKAHLQASSDKSVYTLSPEFTGMLGEGIVNALTAISTPDPKYAIVDSYDFRLSDPSNDLNIGDILELDVDIRNIFGKLEDVSIEVVASKLATKGLLSTDSIAYKIDNIEAQAPIRIKSLFTGKCVANVPLDSKIEFIITIKSKGEIISNKVASLLVNKSFLNYFPNNISTTVSSKGNIGFNDFPKNEQGIGFKYKDGPKLLFEGALMFGKKWSDTISKYDLWDIARTENGQRNNGFVILERAEKHDKANYSTISAKYKTRIKENNYQGYEIQQNVYAFAAPEDANYIISEYNVKNISNLDDDSLFLGVYFDWDNAKYTHSSTARYDNVDNFSFCGGDSPDEENPYTGLKLLSPQTINYAPILNSSATFGIYDGFTDDEKIKAMSSGIMKNESEGKGDISEVMAAGPFSLKVGESTKIAFAMLAGKNKDEITQAATRSTKYLERLSVKEYTYSSDRFSHYPNPSKDGKITARIKLENDEIMDLIIFDECGRMISTIAENHLYLKGLSEVPIDLSKLNAGTYFLTLRNNKHYFLDKITIVK